MKNKTSWLGKPYYRVPNLILIASGIMYFLVLVYGLAYETSFWYAPMYWCLQSALIGSVADWFAVNALFRKPLGFSYHTAIITRKKASLVRSVADFVAKHLLSTNKIIVLIEKAPWLEWIEKIISSTEGQNIAIKTVAALLQRVNTTNTKAKIIELLTNKIEKIPVDRLLYDWITRDNGKYIDCYYRSCVNALVSIAKKNTTKQAIADKINDYINQKSWLERMMLSNVVDIEKLSQIIQEQIIKFLEEASDVETTPYNILHTNLLEIIKALTPGSKGSLLISDIYREWIKGIDLEVVISQKVFPIMDEYTRQDENGQSKLACIIVEQLVALWQGYNKTSMIKLKIVELAKELASALLMAFHDVISLTITQVLNALDDKAFATFIEDKVGEDLGWIRINGALVGAVTGLLVWAFLEGFYMPYIVPYLFKI